jgi:hypothetical protein
LISLEKTPVIRIGGTRPELQENNLIKRYSIKPEGHPAIMANESGKIYTIGNIVQREMRNQGSADTLPRARRASDPELLKYTEVVYKKQ